MKRLFFQIAFALLVLVPGLAFSSAQASDMHNVHGYAWSDGAGWISFNCDDMKLCARTPYGVSLSSAGELSGYAWSDAIGWISFNKDDLSECPYGTCQAALQGGELTGWARALSGKDEDSWDGWIRLSTSSYGPVLSGINFSGFAWGSDAIGWITFNPPGGGVYVVPDVSVSLSANPTSLPQGQKTTLTWQSQNATRCESDMFETGGKTAGSANVVPLAPTTYRLTCDGVVGSATAETPVSTALAPAHIESSVDTVVVGERATLSWNCPFSTGSSGVNFSTSNHLSGSISVAPATTTSYIIHCNPYGTQAGVSVNVLHPRVSIDVEPALVQVGERPKLSWDSSLVIPGSCRISGPGLSISGDAGSTTLPPISVQSTYTISCATKGSDVSASAIVTIIPHFE